MLFLFILPEKFNHKGQTSSHHGTGRDHLCSFKRTGRVWFTCMGTSLECEFYHGCQINQGGCDPGNAAMQTRNVGCCWERAILICRTVCMVHRSFQNSVSNFLSCQPSVAPPFPGSPVTSAVELGVWGQGKERAGDKTVWRPMTICMITHSRSETKFKCAESVRLSFPTSDLV